mgnify:CR=1 FL=1
MQSRGGLAASAIARQRPVRLFLSGPAGGVVGGLEAGKSAGFRDLITVDIGGTSCDIALIANGEPLIRGEGSIDGYTVRVPMVDVTAIGAGFLVFHDQLGTTPAWEAVHADCFVLVLVAGWMLSSAQAVVAGAKASAGQVVIELGEARGVLVDRLGSRGLLGQPHLFQILVFALQLAQLFLDQLQAPLRGLVGFLLDGFALDLQLDQAAIQAICAGVPEFIGGSADLMGSVFTNWPGSKVVARSGAGNIVNFGVREFAMAAITNGLALHGGFIPETGTFLTFSDYSRNALRMAALMKQRVLFVYTHDSIGLGEDGPTHQPVEHAATLRMVKSVEWMADNLTEIPLLLFAFARGDSGGGSTWPAIWSAQLAARAFGVGSAPTSILGAFHQEESFKILGVPADKGWSMMAMVSFGYPKGRWAVAERRPAHEVAYRDQWGADPGFSTPTPLWP